MTLALAAAIPLSAQTGGNNFAYESFKPYGDVTPGVESFAMTKYGIVSPSMYTGAMSYSIPIYTYSDPDFTIPISLDYNYDGYKPSMASGSIGLGWALNCGGVITREIKGIPDEGLLGDTNTHGWYHTIMDEIDVVDESDVHGAYQPNVKSSIFSLANISAASSALWTPSCDEFKGVMQSLDACSETPVCIPEGTSTKYDLAPDIFHFSFCGMNGDFMIVGKKPNGKVKIRVYNSNVPHGELDIEMDPIDFANDVPEFIITDGRGYKYYFGGQWKNIETSSSYPLKPKNIFVSAGQETSTSLTAFRLYKIEAPARNGSTKRVLEFNYSSNKQFHKTVTVGYMTGIHFSWRYHNTNDTMDNNGGVSDYADYAHVHGGCTPLLESISIDNHELVVFSYSQKARNEIDQTCFEMQHVGNVTPHHSFENISPHSLCLSEIQIYNHDNERVESFVLDQEYAAHGTPKMFLKSVSGMKMGRYEFGYKLDNFYLPPNDTKGFDHWGYWNGKIVGAITNHVAMNDYGVPVSNIYAQISDTVKESDWNKAVCGALQRIYYPSGGESLIEYEGNMAGRRVTTYSVPQVCAPYEVGGIRVKSITNMANDGVYDSIEFQYAYTDSSPSGVLMQMPRYAVWEEFDYTSEYSIGTFYGHFEYVSYSGNCNSMQMRDNHIGYSSVILHYPDSSYVVKTFSNYDLDHSDEYEYSYVRTGKKIYSNFDSITGSSSIDNIFPPDIDRKSMRGLPLSDHYYDAHGNLKRTIINEYGEDEVDIPRIYYSDANSFIRTSYHAISPMLISKEESTYEDSLAIVSLESYSYNDFGQIESVEHYDNTERVKEYYRYHHLSTYPSSVKSLAVRTSTIGSGAEKIIAKEEYQYEPYNVKPTMITSYPVVNPRPIDPRFGIFNTPAGNDTRVCTFTYDGNFRLTGAQFPGSAYIEYGWNGNHIVSKTVNIPDNMFLFNWKDLVGLTRVQDPSGKSESYLYDTKNRLMQRKDTQGNPTEEYHYHLENEQ